MIKLREYQLLAISKIRQAFSEKKKSVILQLPTGGGKTIVFTAMAKTAVERSKSVLVITDRIELTTQAGNTFEEFGITAKLLTQKTKVIEPGGVWVAMAETIKRRLKNPDYFNFVQSFDLIIIDEAHKQTFDRLFEAITPEQFVIGATATPFRKGKMTPLRKHYDEIVMGSQIQELIDTGYLSPAIYYVVPVDGLNTIKTKAGEYDVNDIERVFDREAVYEGAVANYKKYCNGRKTILFTASVKNSKKLVEEFNKNGISAVHLDGDTPKNEREQILLDFKNGKFLVLGNVGVLTTGFDEPSVSCIITYRPTKSLPLWLQMCGRGSRIFEGKKDFVVLDFGRNCHHHGCWHDNRGWSLDIKKTKKKPAPLKECKGCGALIHANVSICQYCGYEYKQTVKPKSMVEVVLEKLTYSEINKRDWTFYELEEIRKLKGYKVGWVLRRFKTVQDFEEYAKLKGYSNGWVFHQTKIYLK